MLLFLFYLQSLVALLVDFELIVSSSSLPRTAAATVRAVLFSINCIFFLARRSLPRAASLVFLSLSSLFGFLFGVLRQGDGLDFVVAAAAATAFDNDADIDCFTFPPFGFRFVIVCCNPFFFFLYYRWWYCYIIVVVIADGICFTTVSVTAPASVVSI